MYNTRIAPSPTGDMHIGTARTAYFNWLAARATGGKFILRVDDTDVERNRQECVDIILKTMNWLGLNYDELFYQSQRTELHVGTAQYILDAGLATKLDNGAIALKWHPEMPNTWHDEIAGDIPITATNIEQIDRRLILLRGGDKIGQPTYQLASVVDDYNLDINYIIRGTDHLTNTAKQIAIWWAMNKAQGVDKPLPKFAHVGLIFKDKKKMSKRDGASSMLAYMERGYNAGALLNFMLRLGWGPRVDDKSTSTITREQALGLFVAGGSMRGSNAGFDIAKLDNFDKKYKATVKVAA